MWQFYFSYNITNFNLSKIEENNNIIFEQSVKSVYLSYAYCICCEATEALKLTKITKHQLLYVFLGKFLLMFIHTKILLKNYNIFDFPKAVICVCFFFQAFPHIWKSFLVSFKTKQNLCIF